MDFFELIKVRESCRSYADRPVEREKLVSCIEAARLAPSACNSQPWRFIVVHRPDLVAPLSGCLASQGINGFTKSCPAFIVVIEEKAKLSRRIAEVLPSQTYAQLDVGIATAHIVLAAAEQGLSTCIMGWLDEEKLKTLLSIGEEEKVRLVVAVGYAAEVGQRAKVRKPVEEIATFVE